MIRITDEAEQTVARRLFDREWVPGDWRWEQYPQPNRWQLLARQVLEAALPHLTDDGAAPFELETERISWHRKEGYEAGLAARGATPAIDREALTQLLKSNRFAPYVSDERLADMVIELIGAPNSGASEDDRVTR